MNKKRNIVLIIITLIVLFLVLIFGKDIIYRNKKEVTIISKNNIAGYPFILKFLDIEDQVKLNQELNNNCFSINKYGFIQDGDLCEKDILRQEIKNKDEVVEKVKKWLIDNSKFTGITSKNDIVVEKILDIDGCIKCNQLNLDNKVISLRIDFKNQTYNGLPIMGNINNPIVWADNNGVSKIKGFWFPKISVPVQELISESDIKKSLIGKSTGYSTMAGKPITFNIKEKDLIEPASKVIFVKETNEGLEFHLAWEIKISGTVMFYIDALTGEKLEEIPIIIS